MSQAQHGCRGYAETPVPTSPRRGKLRVSTASATPRPAVSWRPAQPSSAEAARTAFRSADEIDNPQALDLRTILNGPVVQQSGTADMTFSIAELVAEISALVMLEAGDVILTGTPSDLGALVEPVYLTPGDVIQVHIDGIGVLGNPVQRRLPVPN